MDADTDLKVASNIGNIVKARYYVESIGVIGHGEFYIVILSIPGRTYNFQVLAI